MRKEAFLVGLIFLFLTCTSFGVSAQETSTPSDCIDAIAMTCCPWENEVSCDSNKSNLAAPLYQLLTKQKVIFPSRGRDPNKLKARENISIFVVCLSIFNIIIMGLLAFVGFPRLRGGFSTVGPWRLHWWTLDVIGLVGGISMAYASIWAPMKIWEVSFRLEYIKFIEDGLQDTFAKCSHVSRAEINEHLAGGTTWSVEGCSVRREKGAPVNYVATMVDAFLDRSNTRQELFNSHPQLGPFPILHRGIFYNRLFLVECLSTLLIYLSDFFRRLSLREQANAVILAIQSQHRLPSFLFWFCGGAAVSLSSGGMGLLLFYF